METQALQTGDGGFISGDPGTSRHPVQSTGADTSIASLACSAFVGIEKSLDG